MGWDDDHSVEREPNFRDDHTFNGGGDTPSDLRSPGSVANPGSKCHNCGVDIGGISSGQPCPGCGYAVQLSAPALDRFEQRADRTLGREVESPNQIVAGAASVYDEPDFLPHRDCESVDRDWSCSQCGYNLRGLEPGCPCPECGETNFYRPAPEGADSYQARMRKKLQSTPVYTGWSVAIVAVLLGGPFAIVGAIFEGFRSVAGWSGAAMLVGLGPVAEEALKVGLAAMIIERRAYLFQRSSQIQLATIGCAFVFAAVENVLYLTNSSPPASEELIVWRWTVCVILHVGCTAIASCGLVKVWQRAITERRQPNLSDGLGMLFVAIAIHSCYNGAMLAWSMVGGPF